MYTKDYPLLLALLALAGAMVLCGGDPDTSQAIKGGALLLTSAVIWAGWYMGRRLMLGVAGLTEIVRLMEASRKDHPTE